MPQTNSRPVLMYGWIVALGLLLVEVIAQLIPLPGIFLMMVGAPFWSVAILNVALLLLLLDAMASRERRTLILIPILIYSGCFIASLIADQQFSLLERQTKSLNEARFALHRSGQLFAFPDHEAERVGYSIAAEYLVPTVYTVDRAGAWTLNSVEPQGACDILQYRDDIHTSALERFREIRMGRVSGLETTGDDLRCMVQQGAAPPVGADVIRFSKDASGVLLKKDLNIYTDQSGAALQMGKVGLFPRLPFFVAGCMLVDGGEDAGWRCMFEPLYRERRIAAGSDTVLGQTTMLANRLHLSPRPAGPIDPSEVFDAAPTPLGNQLFR